MKIQNCWQAYLNTLPPSHEHRFASLPESWSFGNTASLANDLVDLVLNGIKTATCSRYAGENILVDAGLSILLNGENEPKCLIETYEITITPFSQVDATFARDEGEGDLSLEYWQRMHWDFFSAEAKLENYSVSKDMLLSCERFKVLFRC